MCCAQGRIVVPPYEDSPQPFDALFHNKDPRNKYFLDDIRSFNSMSAFTSLGGKVHTTLNNGRAPPVFILNGENYHQIGGLLPLPGNGPKFGQLNIYDTENEVHNRMSVVRCVSFIPFFTKLLLSGLLFSFVSTLNVFFLLFFLFSFECFLFANAVSTSFSSR